MKEHLATLGVVLRKVLERELPSLGPGWWEQGGDLVEVEPEVLHRQVKVAVDAGHSGGLAGEALPGPHLPEVVAQGEVLTVEPGLRGAGDPGHPHVGELDAEAVAVPERGVELVVV